MPAEVFTISGASDEGLGTPASYPAALRTDAGGGGSTSAPPPVQLQNALKALGTTAGDSLLSGVHVDGVIGPATVKAVNHALANYVGATPGFPSANLALEKVRQSAAALAAIISQRVRESGGTIPPPQVSKPRAMVRHASGALVPAPEAPPETDRRWIWWAVGGVGTLLILTLAVGAARKHRALQAA